MGKFYKYLTILIFIDLLFIVTAQIVPGGSPGQPSSIGSILINGILNIGGLSLTDLFSEIIGQFGSLFSSPTGFASLLIAGGVTLGTVFTRSESLLYIPIGISFGLLTSDIILIYTYLASLNNVLATILMAPLSILFVVTILEWVRGKD